MKEREGNNERKNTQNKTLCSVDTNDQCFPAKKKKKKKKKEIYVYIYIYKYFFLCLNA